MLAIVIGFEVKNRSLDPLQRRILEIIKTLNENRKQPGLTTSPEGDKAWCDSGPCDGAAILANLNVGYKTDNRIAHSSAQMQMALLELSDKGYALSGNEIWQGRPAVVAYRLSELGEAQFKSWIARLGYRIKSIASNSSGLSRVLYTVFGVLLTLIWAHRQLIAVAFRYLKKSLGL